MLTFAQKMLRNRFYWLTRIKSIMIDFYIKLWIWFTFLFILSLKYDRFGYMQFSYMYIRVFQNTKDRAIFKHFHVISKDIFIKNNNKEKNIGTKI